MVLRSFYHTTVLWDYWLILTLLSTNLICKYDSMIPFLSITVCKDKSEREESTKKHVWESLRDGSEIEQSYFWPQQLIHHSQALLSVSDSEEPLTNPQKALIHISNIPISSLFPHASITTISFFILFHFSHIFNSLLVYFLNISYAQYFFFFQGVTSLLKVLLFF